MDILIFVIPFVIYIFSAQILENIWKKERKIILNKNLNIGLIVIVSILCISLNLLINTWLPLVNELFVSSNNLTDANMLIMFIYSIISIIIAPLLEEVFFRYYLFEKLKVKTNNFLSLLITSFVFGIIHFYGITGLISSVCVGIILQLTYNKTSNLTGTIIIHSICNLFITLLGLISIPVNNISLFIFVFAFFISFIMFFIKIKRKSEINR